MLIRCDAAPEIGFGHVVRCLALADELRDSHACRVDFAMLQGPQGVAQVQAQGYGVYQPSQGIKYLDEGAWLQDLISKCQHQVLILDVRTDLATEAVQSMRESGVLVVTIDDPSDRRLHADLAFYPPVPQVERMDWSGFTGQCYVGWDWVLLRPQFAEAARRARARGSESTAGSQRHDKKLTILVTMGGSDPAGLTLMAIDAIEQLRGDMRVMLVLGPGFMHQAVLVKRLAVAEQNYEIHNNVSDIASIMIRADVAIASFGVTAFELATCKVPSIYLSLTADHEISASVFDSMEFGLSLGIWTGVSVDELAQALMVLIYDFRQCKKSKLYASHPDGLGVKRCSAVIVDASEKQLNGPLKNDKDKVEAVRHAEP